jgi:hypothetical protein
MPIGEIWRLRPLRRSTGNGEWRAATVTPPLLTTAGYRNRTDAIAISVGPLIVIVIVVLAKIDAFLSSYLCA